MRRSKTIFFAFLIVGLFNTPAQTQAQTDSTQFHFPLEVGTIWVYQFKSAFITEKCGFGCPIERWEVVERTESEENGVCGRIEATRKGTNLHYYEFSLCFNNERLTRFPATDGGFPFTSSSHLASEVLADFSKPIGVYWPTPIATYADAYKRNEIGITDIEGDITVNTYYRSYNGEYEPGSNLRYVYAEDHTYRPGIGFVQFHYWHTFGDKEELRGAVINGTVIGDTTFVYPTSIDDVLLTERSDGPQLLGAYPNPFNPSTVVSYRLSVGPHGDAPLHVLIHVVNQLGQRVATLYNGIQTPGQHSVTFDAAGLPSGMYIVVLETNSGLDVRKVTLVK